MKLSRAAYRALTALVDAGGTGVRAAHLPPSARTLLAAKSDLLVALNLAYRHDLPGTPDGRNTYTLTTAGRTAAAAYRKEMTTP